MNIPSWTTLKTLGTNKTVQSATIWAVVVPVAAKLFLRVEETIKFVIPPAQQVEIHLSLPFSWKVFFFVALSFMIANLIFKLRCPAIIQETSSFKEFSEQKRSTSELQEILKFMTLLNGDQERLKTNWLNWCAMRESCLLTSQSHQSYNSANDEKLLPEMYAFCISWLSVQKICWRSVVSLLYGLGFLGLLVLAYQNVVFVMQQW